MDQVTQEVNQKIKSKVYCESKHFRMQPELLNDIEQGRDITPDQANIVLFSGDTQIEPTNFEKAWNHTDANDQEKWRMTTKKEFNDMDSKKTWGTIKKEDIPIKRRAIKGKLIFKIK
jgi:hypothetical protein